MALAQDSPQSFREAIGVARRTLEINHDLVQKQVIETEAEQLVVAAYRKATGKLLTRMELFTRITDRFPEEAGKQLLLMAGARASGKPLQHVTGYQFFLEHEYEVGPDVLVPRPETEFVVVTAITALKRRSEPPRLGVEVGLGSGAISIELLSQFTGLAIYASELTDGAAAIAERNASRILGDQENRGRLKILRSRESAEVWEPFARAGVAEKVDFIVSNPPYLIQADPIDREVIDYEPFTALFAPETDPVYFYRAIAEGAQDRLRKGGQVFLEVPPERAQDVLALFPFPRWRSAVLKDLTDRDRMVIATLEV